MASFGELIRSVAHSLLPFAWRKGSRVRLQSLRYLGHASRSTEVGAEPGEAVINDVGVSVIEPGEH
jgi:hypothetical protein